MLKKLFNLLIFIPLAVIIISIAVANRHVVRLALDPISPETPFLAIDAPFFAFLFGCPLNRCFNRWVCSLVRSGENGAMLLNCAAMKHKNGAKKLNG